MKLINILFVVTLFLYIPVLSCHVEKNERNDINTDPKTTDNDDLVKVYKDFPDGAIYNLAWKKENKEINTFNRIDKGNIVMTAQTTGLENGELLDFDIFTDNETKVAHFVGQVNNNKVEVKIDDTSIFDWMMYDDEMYEYYRERGKDIDMENFIVLYEKDDIQRLNPIVYGAIGLSYGSAGEKYRAYKPYYFTVNGQSKSGFLEIISAYIITRDKDPYYVGDLIRFRLAENEEEL